MGDNVRVAVRVRPFNAREKGMEAKPCFEMDKSTQQTVLINPEDGQRKVFTFDYSYNSFVSRDDPEYASQRNVWDDIGVSMLENAWQGYNCSLFAYGQTGSGKSYSMMGYGEDKGIIPIASEEMFVRIAQNEDPDLTFRVETSMLEIYMEKVRDLFNPGATKKANDTLKVRDHPKKGPYVEGLKKNPVSSYQDIEHLMEVGAAARTVASTNMNATSSRAHTIFQIILTQTKLDKAQGKATDKVSIINLVDLAGSERAASTGATGDRLKEGAAINQSLSALGNVINALAENSGKKKKKMVPYRNSVLTMLLKNSLGGNAKTAMIAAMSPADVNYDETLSTLRYADRAKQIKNKAIINEDPNEKLIKSLKAEIDALKAALAGGGGDLSALGMASLGAGSDPQASKQNEEQMRKMKEQLEANERLLQEQSKSWEEKVKEAEEAAAERAKNLAKLGVLNAGASKEEIAAKRTTHPHLSNLHEDAAMNHHLLYFLEKETTRFGRQDAEVDQDVCLAGLSIKKEHCIFVRDGSGKIVVNPMAGAKVYVNGAELKGDQQLNHCDRVIIGSNHVFIFLDPEGLTAEQDLPPSEDASQPRKHDEFTWQYAVNEMNKAQMDALSEKEREMREKAEEEARKMAEKIAALEQQMNAQRQDAESQMETRKREFETRERQLVVELETIKARVGDVSQDSRAQEIMKELQYARELYTKEQEAAAKAAKEFEEKMKQQQEQEKRLAEEREKRMKERRIIDAKMMETIPLLNEVNLMAEEMGKPQRFDMQLMANPAKVKQAVRDGDSEHFLSVVSTELWIRVWTEGDSLPEDMWPYDKFLNRLYLMRELYQNFVESGYDWNVLYGEGYTAESDPFYDPPTQRLSGSASVYLDPICYMLDIKENTPILDYKGTQKGELNVVITPELGELATDDEKRAQQQEFANALLPSPTSNFSGQYYGDEMGSMMMSPLASQASSAGFNFEGEEDEPQEDSRHGEESKGPEDTGAADSDDDGPKKTFGSLHETLDALVMGEATLKDLVGHKLKLTISIKEARGVDARFNSNVRVAFRFPENGKEIWTPPCPLRTINPKFDFTHEINLILDKDIVSFIEKDAIEFHVHGDMEFQDMGQEGYDGYAAAEDYRADDTAEANEAQTASGGKADVGDLPLSIEDRSRIEELEARLASARQKLSSTEKEREEATDHKENFDQRIQDLRNKIAAEEKKRVEAEKELEAARVSEKKRVAELEKQREKERKEQDAKLKEMQMELEALKKKSKACVLF